MLRTLRLLSAFLLLTLCAPLAASAAPAGGPLGDWAGIFVSGDYRAHSGSPSEVFDNGRRDIGQAFVDSGLKPENTVHFSVMDALHGSSPEKPRHLDPDTLSNEMTRITAQAKAGCLFFYTSHGAPGALKMGDYVMEPGGLKDLLDGTCGTRPTVVVLSACYSGSFIPALAAPNRMIMTAAREDRSSFGCGEEDTYTFFDGCILQVLPASTTFENLATNVAVCVERRETQMSLVPASSPQMSMGAQFGPLVARLALARTYTVKAGDTLRTIATAMYGSDSKAGVILAANRTVLPNAAALRPGQKLKIPPA